MRTEIYFNVQGPTLDVLKENAEAEYRKLTDDPEATLPYSATITVEPQDTETTGTGVRTVVNWSGRVAVALTADKDVH